MAKELYNAGERQAGGLGIGTDGAAPCLRADDHPAAVAIGTPCVAFGNDGLVGGDCARTLTGDHESRVTDTGQSVVVGLDLYNQAETGGVSMPVTAAASDPHHVPCIGMKYLASEKSREPTSVECAQALATCPDAAVAMAVGVSFDGRNGAPPVIDECSHTETFGTNPGYKIGVAIGCDRRNQTGCDEVQPALQSTVSDGGSTCAVSGSAGEYVVRRLTPRECERLQGFPDDWTRIPYRGKPAEECPDGPRYKAMGNSWGTNCAEWILRRVLAARPVWHPEPDEPSTTERKE